MRAGDDGLHGLRGVTRQTGQPVAGEVFLVSVAESTAPSKNSVAAILASASSLRGFVSRGLQTFATCGIRARTTESSRLGTCCGLASPPRWMRAAPRPNSSHYSVAKGSLR